MNREIINWENRKETMPPTKWIQQGINLYRELLDEDPDNIKYKEELAKLLSTKGKDEKLFSFNLGEAEQLFKEVLEVNPDHSEAHYRLGHIYFEKGNFYKKSANQSKMEKFYNESVRWFEKALNYPLSNTQLVRTYCTLAKAYHFLEYFSESNEYLKKATEADNERNFTDEIKEVEEAIAEKGVNIAVVQNSDGTSLLVTSEQLAIVIGEIVDDGEIVFDLSSLQPTILGNEHVEILERRAACILYVLDNKKDTFVSLEEIMQEVFENQIKSLNSIKSYISEIRKILKRCSPNDFEGNPIINKRGIGYQLNRNIKLNIVEAIHR